MHNALESVKQKAELMFWLYTRAEVACSTTKGVDFFFFLHYGECLRMRAHTWVVFAGVTVSLALGKLVMTGKHPRSEDTAIEDKRDSKQARSMQQGTSTTPGPTAKEIKAAEDARARLAGAEVWQCVSVGHDCMCRCKALHPMMGRTAAEAHV